MKMGQSLPLLRPEGSKATPGGYENPQEQENWTMKIYWSSAKTVQKGQPLVISPQDMKSGKGKFADLAGGGPGVWKGAPPSGWGWGQWPNRESSLPVPKDASFKGDHHVTGNYLPDMKFSVVQHDFLPQLEVTTGGDLNASIPVSWRPVKGAIGTFIYAVAANQAKKETIVWTSSSKPSMGIQGHEHSSKIKELVNSGVVLRPDVSACDIPVGIFAGCEGVVVMANAWGEDYSYPPKPANAPKNWKPDWTVNALFVSSWTGMPGVDMGAIMQGPYAQDEDAQTGEEKPAKNAKKTEGGKSKEKQQKSPGMRLPLPGIKF
jgi:hypothetical protein